MITNKMHGYSRFRNLAFRSVLLALTVLLGGGMVSHTSTSSAGRQYNSLWRQWTRSDFHAWILKGAVITGTDVDPEVRLTVQRGYRPRCTATAIDGGLARSDAQFGLCAGRDPFPPGQYRHGNNYYNGATFLFGTLRSPIHPVIRPIDHLIVSWDAVTPSGTWIQIHARLRGRWGWTDWYRLPVWASTFHTIHRHSVESRGDSNGRVDVDTVSLGAGHEALAYQIEVTLFTTTPTSSPRLRFVTAIASHDAGGRTVDAPIRGVQRIDLPVPQHSQMAASYRGLRYGGGGEVWCSPASITMILGYWARVLHQPTLIHTVPEVAAGVYDSTYDGTGNWPFNTAYAAQFGLRAYVMRMSSLSQVEPWIAARVPIVISVAFTRGELPGEPVEVSDGHLMVIRGFTARGDVITNDPAASSDARVRIIYNRAALEHVWQAGSHGTIYVVYPKRWTTPAIQDTRDDEATPRGASG